MITKENLIGSLYPIRNENNEVVGYKKIIEIYDVDNIAGCAVKLSNDPSSSLTIMSYAIAAKITKNKEESDRAFGVESSNTQIFEA